MKVETEFNTSIAASLIERAVIMYVETSKIDVIVLIGNVKMCHSQTDLLFSESESVHRY
jgi:hypothetical protein